MSMLNRKSDKMMQKSTLGSNVRKRLSDITNLSSQHKSSPLKDQENVVRGIADSSTKNFIQQLSKENEVMRKLIQEKDKIIQSNGVELQKLRVSLQRTYLQNSLLAQSNSQMLAELNLSKDKLKVLRHELACKDALYSAKVLELQEKAKVQCKEYSVQEGDRKPKKTAVNESMQAVHTVTQVHNDNESKVSKTKRGRATRSQSLGATTSRQAVDQEIAENKRRCVRRQSVKLKRKSQTDFFEIDVANTLVTETLEQPLHETTSEKLEGDKQHLMQSPRCPVPQRSSIGRPVRRAAEKVQSYKDPSLNTKMRRP